MPIQFQCPHCSATLQASSANSGARAKCKKCSQIVTIPVAARKDVQQAKKKPPVAKAAVAKKDAPASARKSSAPVKPSASASLNPTSDRSAATTFEPDFSAIASSLPAFVAGQADPTSDAPSSSDSPESMEDVFADLPAFQQLDAPVAKQTSADEEFHRMMMSGGSPADFAPQAIVPAAADVPQPVVRTTASKPAPDHSNIADVLVGLDATIQSAVVEQQVKNEKAVRAKCTVDQIRSAFAKPLGDVQRLSGLQRKQMQSAIAVAAVPLGFVVAVIGGTIGMFFLYRSWFFGISETMLHPLIGLTFVVLTILLICCWVPTVNLLFAGLHLLRGGNEPDASATQLTRESQPVMYEFVDQICEKLGAPKPCRIDLDCEFNATASLRRGWLSSGSNDLVLTIGIPFIAVQNTQQLASVIAHEFGHFRQGSAMKTYYVIGTLTRWFMLTASSGAGYFYWFGYLTHMLSGNLSREMEWDADRHAIHLAGTKAFEESSALLERYGVAYAVTIDNLVMLFQSGILVDNIPRFMMHIGRTMPASVIRRIAEDTEQQRLDRLDSHPPTRDRVKAARELQQAGILTLKRPALDLIDHWTPLCKKLTLDFYAENLGFDRKEINESHVTPLEELLRDEHRLLLDRAEKE